MTKREHVQLWHKKQGKETGVNALAKRGTIQGAKPVAGQLKLTPAQAFFKNLKGAIRKAT
ncbi:MAG: hypothetical protein HQL17_04195 [Candidatus Omnitrophica bacterium]|nr:hypothetical protein [Candidatus Omnitrophota bacterium]